MSGELSEAERAELEKELESSAAAESSSTKSHGTALLTDELQRKQPSAWALSKNVRSGAAEPKYRGRGNRSESFAPQWRCAILIIATLSYSLCDRGRRRFSHDGASCTALQTEESEVKSYHRLQPVLLLEPSSPTGAKRSSSKGWRKVRLRGYGISQVAQDSRFMKAG